MKLYSESTQMHQLAIAHNTKKSNLILLGDRIMF